MKDGNTGTGTKGFPPGAWAYPVKGANEEGYKVGRKKGGKGNKEVGKPGNGFLTSVFAPRPITKIDPLFSRDNYDYLYESARRYARLAGCGYAFRHDPDDFAGLYGAFDGLLPDNQKLYLSRNGHELGFYIMDDVMEYLTYHIPVQIMDGARGKLRDLYLSFFSLLQQKQEFVPFCDNPLLPYFTAESQYGHVDKKWASLLKRYSGGTIKRKMEMFSMEPEYDIDSLKGKIDSYRASGRKTKNILALMRKGLDIIGEDLFFNYSAYSIEDDDYYDTYCPVEVSRLIHLIYDHRDIITENILECVCNEVNEQGYEFLSSELLRVEPFMTRPFNENKPLYNYINWLNNFNNELRNI